MCHIEIQEKTVGNQIVSFSQDQCWLTLDLDNGTSLSICARGNEEQWVVVHGDMDRYLNETIVSVEKGETWLSIQFEHGTNLDINSSGNEYHWLDVD